MTESLHPVNVGACRCPGAPHADGDVVFLDTELSTPAGIAAQAGLNDGASWEERYTGLVMGLMRFSVRDWTFRDEDGLVPITPANVDRMLPWLKGGKEVAAACVNLHQATVLTPFVEAFNARKTKQKASGPRTTPKKFSSPNGSTATSST
jgi:hypothetical protein